MMEYLVLYGLMKDNKLEANFTMSYCDDLDKALILQGQLNTNGGRAYKSVIINLVTMEPVPNSHVHTLYGDFRERNS